jgi:type II secretory pathway pseudopilin PulG
MKKCSYCGCENPGEATHCSGCGKDDFKVIAPPVISPIADPNRANIQLGQKYLLLRLLIAVGVGMVISAISIYVAWANAGNARAAWDERELTRIYLRNIDEAIVLYQQKSNALPSSLEQLCAITNADNMGFLQRLLEDKGGFGDAWQHPLIYSKDGTNFLVASYGRDGKPGGRGPDADLTDKNPRPKEAWPTFGQFLQNERFYGMIGSSIICGILAAFLSMLTVRVPDLSRRGITILVLSLCATLIGTLLVATMITAVHVPSGH